MTKRGSLTTEADCKEKKQMKDDSWCWSKVRSWWAEGEVISVWFTSKLFIGVVHWVCQPLYIVALMAGLMGLIFRNELFSILELICGPPFVIVRPVTLPSYLIYYT